VTALSETTLADDSTASELRVSDLLRDDTGLALQNRDLAKRHNALVDTVEQYMKDQEARLKAAE